MSTLCKKWVWMIYMLVCYVPHQRLPFCKNQVFKTPYSWCRAPVNMITYTFCPILDDLTSLLAVSIFFNKTFGNMPLVKKLLDCRVRLSYIFNNPFMSIRNKDWYCQSCSCHEEVKTSLTTIQLHCITAARLVSLKILSLINTTLAWINILVLLFSVNCKMSVFFSSKLSHQ